MKIISRISLFLMLTLSLVLSACEGTVESDSISDSQAGEQIAQLTVQKTTEPTLAPAKESTKETTPTSVAEGNVEENPQIITQADYGPEDFPEGINPLTGLAVEKPEYLSLPPALVSISNFPASGRPQSGLSFSPITFEIAIGEGMTRFLTMFYGQFPDAVSGQTEGNSPTIGPVRSGRLSYEDIRATYSGFLVMASAWEGVSTNLNDSTSVYGSNDSDINSATVSSNRLLEIARSESDGYPGSNFNLEGLKFSQTPPDGGLTANSVWVFYSALNQVQWHYDETLNAYIRYDIKTDGSDEFVMATDRLTGEPISKENLIVIFAEHDYQAPTLIDINLMNHPPTKALLFRDGQMHKIFWTTQFGDYEKETGLIRPMRFVDSEGNAVPLRPGQTWVSIVSLSSYFVESAVSEYPFYPVVEQTGTGLWLIRYKGKY